MAVQKKLPIRVFLLRLGWVLVCSLPFGFWGSCLLWWDLLILLGHPWLGDVLYHSSAPLVRLFVFASVIMGSVSFFVFVSSFFVWFSLLNLSLSLDVPCGLSCHSISMLPPVPCTQYCITHLIMHPSIYAPWLSLFAVRSQLLLLSASWQSYFHVY